MQYIFAHQVSAAAVAADHHATSRSMALRMALSRYTRNLLPTFFHREEADQREICGIKSNDLLLNAFVDHLYISFLPASTGNAPTSSGLFIEKTSFF
ncbi:hypothetical protein ACLK11_21150 [Escherichia coli]